jgi:hypothetical protein
MIEIRDLFPPKPAERERVLDHVLGLPDDLSSKSISFAFCTTGHSGLTWVARKEA